MCRVAIVVEGGTGKLIGEYLERVGEDISGECRSHCGSQAGTGLGNTVDGADHLEGELRGVGGESQVGSWSG